MRKTYSLMLTELSAFQHLPSFPEKAFSFWKRAAILRDLDYKTIIAQHNGTFSALPLGHDKRWCYPIPLTCKPPPAVVEEITK